APAGSQEIDLVGADAETADRQQPVGGLQHLVGDLGAGTDAEQRHALQRLAQRFAIERLGQTHDIGEAGTLEQIHGTVVDTFKQQRLRAPLRALAWGWHGISVNGGFAAALRPPTRRSTIGFGYGEKMAL